MRCGDKAGSVLKSFSDVLLGTLFPSSCLSCGAKVEASEPLCGGCWEKVLLAEDEFCFACGHEGRNTRAYFDRTGCGIESHTDFRAKAVFVAGSEILSLVHAFKYRRSSFLGAAMGKLMALALRDVSFVRKESVLVPVPLHAARKRERGFNQSDILADETGKTFGLTVAREALKRKKHSRSQTALAPEERRRNVTDLFAVGNPALVEDRDIILVDDVITTGATAMSCAGALTEAGAKSVSVLSFLVA